MSGPNPSGLCLCGCGRLTPVAQKTRKKLGHVRGEHVRYVHGHGACPPGPKHPNYNGGRSMSHGYPVVSAPDHPRANSWGFVFEHVLIAERALGKPLPERAVVHHVNRDKSDNRSQNLVVCEDEAYHQLLHRRAMDLGLEPRNDPPTLRGERHPGSKLTREGVRAIRKKASAGRPHREIAAEFGISRSLVGKVATREAWRHVA